VADTCWSLIVYALYDIIDAEDMAETLDMLVFHGVAWIWANGNGKA